MLYDWFARLHFGLFTIGAGTIVAAIVTGAVNLLAALPWWALVGVFVGTLMIALGLLGRIVPVLTGRPVPDRTVLAELATAAWQKLMDNRDLIPSAKNADARSKALRRWGHQWEIDIEHALAGDATALADFRHPVDVAQMHYMDVPAAVLWTRLQSLGQYLPASLRVEMALQERWAVEGEQPPAKPSTVLTADQIAEGSRESFRDFVDSPDEPLYAKIVAWAARANENRRQRARVRAWVSLRKTLTREPSPVELDAYAKALYERNDATLAVTETELVAFAQAQASINPAISPQDQT